MLEALSFVPDGLQEEIQKAGISANVVDILQKAQETVQARRDQKMLEQLLSGDENASLRKSLASTEGADEADKANEQAEEQVDPSKQEGAGLRRFKYVAG